MDIVEMDFERSLKMHYFLFTPSLSLCGLTGAARKKTINVCHLLGTTDFCTIPQIGILIGQSSRTPDQTNKGFPEILFSFWSMCSTVRACATDVASENWIHSRATGAARKKNYEWMNEWRLWFHEDYLRVERPKHWLIVIKVNKYIKKRENCL